MKIETVSHWFQIATSIFVVVGLALVVFELRQAKELSHAQIASDSFMYSGERSLALMGENPMSSVVRACFEPENVSDVDIGVLDAYFLHIVEEIERLRTVRALGGLTAGSIDRYYDRLYLIFSFEQGKHWWEMNRHRVGPSIREKGDKGSEMGLQDCKEYFGQIRNGGQK